MSDFYSAIRNIAANVKTQDLKNKYKGSSKEQVMNTIFDKFDALDHFKRFPKELDSNTLDSLSKDGSIDLEVFEVRYNIKHYLFEDGKLSEEKVKKVFGEEININDVQDALDDMLVQSKIEDDKIIEKIGQDIKQNQEKVKAENPNIPEAVLEHVGADDKVKEVVKNGKKYYEIDSDGDGSQIYTYNSAGNVVRLAEDVEMSIDGVTHNVKQTLLFNEDGSKGIGDWGSSGEINEYDNGYTELVDWNNKKVSKRFGKNQFDYSIDLSNGEYKEKLESITLNEGLPTSTKMKFKHDANGKITDIEFNADQKDQTIPIGDYRDLTFKKPPINMTQAQKQDLMDILNAGARLGDDFELKVNGDKIEINPIIKDKDGKYLDSVPKNFKNEIIDLMKKGLHNGSDFDLSVDDDGNYQIDYQSQKSKGYEGDEKIVKYSRDGKTKTTLTTDGNIVKTETTKGGQISVNTSNRDEELLTKLVEGKFNDANDLLGDIDYEVNNFDFYAVCDKYQKMTGKNLIHEVINQYKEGKVNASMLKRLAPTIGWSYYETHFGKDFVPLDFVKEEYNRNIKMFNEVKSFNPRNSQVADMLPSIGERENISANKYSQKISDKTYTVEKSENSITVSCNGQTHTINLNGIHKNIQKTIMDTNPAVLFRIAEKGIKLETLDDTQATQNGGYYPTDNSITMNAGRVSNSVFRRTLAHETGHSLYNKEEFPVNPQLEASFQEEKAAWNEAKDEFKEGNHAYAAEDPTEFFAEAYCLLVTGESKSAYTICKYFPKTLAIVKQMIGD